jgi:hypothetical protein
MVGAAGAGIGAAGSSLDDDGMPIRSDRLYHGRDRYCRAQNST